MGSTVSTDTIGKSNSRGHGRRDALKLFSERRLAPSGVPALCGRSRNAQARARGFYWRFDAEGRIDHDLRSRWAEHLDAGMAASRTRARRPHIWCGRECRPCCFTEPAGEWLLGAYRLLLAYLVVFSHVRVSVLGAIGGYNIGIVAVISFLLLSGFVMTALIEKYYFSVSQTLSFYFDRLIRIAPQFLLYSILTLIAAHVFGLHDRWMPSPPTLGETIPQFLIFPLNLYWLFPRMIIPQAWSLGLEATFYAVFPFVLIFRLRAVAAAVSFVIFMMACTGVLDTDLWGFRLLPGTLFIFICGSWLASADLSWERLAPFVLAAVAALLLTWTYFHPTVALTNSRSVLAGLIVGVPTVSRLRVRADHPSWLSDKAGDLSYGVFLNHVLIIGAMGSFANIHFTELPFTTQLHYISIICAIATVLSLVSFKLVEAPLIARRRSLRRLKWTGEKPA